jgi:hypothetical protein
MFVVVVVLEVVVGEVLFDLLVWSSYCFASFFISS